MLDVIFYHPVDERPVYEITDDSILVLGSIVGFQISGHAGYAEIGEDIVCASISALALHTSNAITEMTDNNVSVTVDDDGFLKVIASNKLDEFGELLMKSLFMSVNEIFIDYNDNYKKNEFINIKFEEV